jgi:hypothetical protein
VSLGACRLGGGIINAQCVANNGNTYQPMEYVNGSYPITDSNGVHYTCDVRAHGGYGVPRSDCCRCNAADAVSATREKMFKVTNAAYHCYYGCRVCTHTSPSLPPSPPPPPSPPTSPPPPSPSSPPPLFDDSCYFEPNVNFTWTGTPLEGASSTLGFSEAAHLCLQRTDCFAVTEDAFENNLEPHKRYVLRGFGELQAEAGTTTLRRSRNHCVPTPPPPSPTPPPQPPSHPFLRMQTRPLYLVSFQATVQTTVEQFDVGAYANRMSTALGTPEVGVTVAPGSVVVTTTAGADDQSGADQLVSELTDMSSDPTLLSELYGAPAEVDVGSISVDQNPDAAMPPPPPPSKSKEDHTLLAILIIVGITVPVVAFLLYLRMDSMARARPPQPKGVPRLKRVGKPYQSVTTSDLPQRRPGAVSFKFDM